MSPTDFTDLHRFFLLLFLSADETYSVGLHRFSRLHWSPLRKRFVLKSSRPSLPLKKAPPLISVFSPQGRRGKPPYSVLEPLRYKVGGPKRSRQILRDGTARGGMRIGEAIVCRLAEDFMAYDAR